MSACTASAVADVAPDGVVGRHIAIAGDAELDEGNIYEALLEGWKHDVRRCLVDHRLQPPEPRQRGARPPVRPHRGPVPRHGLERGHHEIRPPAAGRLRARRRRGFAPLDRRLPQQPVLGAHLPGRRRLACGVVGRSGAGARGAGDRGSARRRRTRRADDQSRRPRHRGDRRASACRRRGRRPADLLHRLHDQGHGAAVRRPQGQPRRPDVTRADGIVSHRHAGAGGTRMGSLRGTRCAPRGAGGIAARRAVRHPAYVRGAARFRRP